MNFSRGVGGSLSHLWKFWRGGGAIIFLQKWKIQGGGGVLSEIPSVVGVWIFFLELHNKIKIHIKSRDVTKILSYKVNITSRRGIKQLGISFGSPFFYFPMKVAEGHIHSSRGKSPAPSS